MALKFKDLMGQSIQATDGEIGKVKDLLFDDRTWKIRYVVVDTGGWLPGRKVLISPSAFYELDTKKESELICNLNKKQVEDSPLLESDKPVSRQYENNLYAYYNWLPYWGMAYPYPDATFNRINASDEGSQTDWSTIESAYNKKFNGHLRSLEEVTGYKIGTKDDKEFGEVSDALIEGKDWLIIDLILNSKKWFAGGKEFVTSPMFVKKIDETTNILHLEQTKQILLDGPDFEFETYGEKYRKSLVLHYFNNAETKQLPKASGTDSNRHHPSM